MRKTLRSLILCQFLCTVILVTVQAQPSQSDLYNKVLLVSQANKAPVIDGIIDANDPWGDEWLPIDKLNDKSTTNNATARFQLLDGGDALYIAVQVSDNTPNNDEKLIPSTYERDCVELFFSMDTSAYDNAGAYKNGSWQIRCQRESKSGNYLDGSTYYYSLLSDNDFSFCSKSNAQGYVQEFIFPYSTLINGANWDEELFRFEIGNSDNTTGQTGGRTQIQFWNNNSDYQWKDTRTFGFVRLAKGDRPFAVAGESQTVFEGDTVKLNGSASYDKDNKQLTYSWIAPEDIVLDNPQSATPSFVAPNVLTLTPYTFSLVVNNGSSSSIASKVVVTVKPLNVVPIANAGTDKTVIGGNTITLDGSASISPQGLPLVYSWTAPEGIELYYSSSKQPMFKSPKVSETKTLTFKLTVSCFGLVSEADTVTVTVLPGHIGTDNVLLVKQAQKAPVIDGVIDDNDSWGDEWLPIDKLNDKSTTNFTTARFQLLDGGDVLYVAVHVNDITPNNDEIAISNSYDRDCIDLFFSMDTNAYDNAGVYKNSSWQIRCQRESSDGRYIESNRLALLSANEKFLYRSESGYSEYTQEFAIPYSVLANGSTWDEEFFRFEICNSDNTTGQNWGRTQIQFWNNNSDYQWRDTRTFGIARLERVDRPFAIAGESQTVFEGDTVKLNGSASYDIGNKQLTYSWTAPKGIVLYNSQSATPSFVAPNVKTLTKYEFSLIVNNGVSSSVASKVVVTVKPANVVPIANAGTDKTVIGGNTVILDGTASVSPQGLPLVYSWTAPAGILLSSSSSKQPSFKSPKVLANTSLTFTLTVSCDGSVSNTDTVTVTLLPEQIIADKVLLVKQAKKSPVIDGIIDANDPWGDEWQPIDKLNDKSTTGNTTARFQLLDGGDALYIAVQVNDKTPNNNADNIVNTYERDCVELFFSMDTNAYDNAGAYKNSSWQIRCQRESSISYIESSRSSVLFSYENFAFSSKSNSESYIQEFIIPYNALANGTTWDEEYFRFEISNSDNTTGQTGGRTQIQFWNNNSDFQWKDTRTFGIVRLEKVERPVAVAGEDQTVVEGTSVKLNGSASYDKDNKQLTYSWTAPKGIVLDNSQLATPSFVAPNVKTLTKYEFSLIVNNGVSSSVASKVVVTVKPVNVVPIANPDYVKHFLQDQYVMLDGTSSISPQGNTLTYQWSAPSGIVLNDSNVARPQFQLPEGFTDSVLVFSLVVSDGEYQSEPQSVKIYISELATGVPVSSRLNNSDNQKILISPNPSSGVFQIKLSNSSHSVIDVIINDLSGRIVMNTKYWDTDNISIDISNQPKGIYFITLTSNRLRETKKIVLD